MSRADQMKLDVSAVNNISLEWHAGGYHSWIRLDIRATVTVLICDEDLVMM